MKCNQIPVELQWRFLICFSSGGVVFARSKIEDGH